MKSALSLSLANCILHLVIIMYDRTVECSVQRSCRIPPKTFHDYKLKWKSLMCFCNVSQFYHNNNDDKKVKYLWHTIWWMGSITVWILLKITWNNTTLTKYIKVGECVNLTRLCIVRFGVPAELLLFDTRFTSLGANAHAYNKLSVSG